MRYGFHPFFCDMNQTINEKSDSKGTALNVLL